MWESAPLHGTPVAVGRFGLNDETVVSAAEIVTLFSDTYDGGFRGQVSRRHGRVAHRGSREGRGSVEGVPRWRVFGRGVPMVFPLASEWFVDPRLAAVS